MMSFGAAVSGRAFGESSSGKSEGSESRWAQQARHQIR
jgi:hypothetical protein